mmetsp:Transcript_80455/g.260691  ORF Transcript_80455/g.260691 Transcript_80455/m.260691 type:complete len:337 (+) Transcript_80455:35-1045(+)
MLMRGRRPSRAERVFHCRTCHGTTPLHRRWTSPGMLDGGTGDVRAPRFSQGNSPASWASTPSPASQRRSSSSSLGVKARPRLKKDSPSTEDSGLAGSALRWPSRRKRSAFSLRSAKSSSAASAVRKVPKGDRSADSNHLVQLSVSSSSSFSHMPFRSFSPPFQMSDDHGGSCNSSPAWTRRMRLSCSSSLARPVRWAQPITPTTLLCVLSAARSDRAKYRSRRAKAHSSLVSDIFLVCPPSLRTAPLQSMSPKQTVPPRGPSLVSPAAPPWDGVRCRTNSVNALPYSCPYHAEPPMFCQLGVLFNQERSSSNFKIRSEGVSLANRTVGASGMATSW